MGARVARLFDDPNGGAVGAEFDHAISFGVADLIGEDRGAGSGRCCLSKHGRKRVAVEDIIPEDQGDMVAGNELVPDDEGLGESIGSALCRVFDRQAPLAAVSQQTREARELGRGRDVQNIPRPRQHQGRQWIIHHRLDVDGQQLFTECQGRGVEPGAMPASQNDSFHRLSTPTNSRSTGGRLDRHGGGNIPKTVILLQASTELIGRCAAVGYWSVVVASTRGPDPPRQAPRVRAKPTISSANPCQLVLPAAEKWKVPQFVVPRSMCRAIAISAAAISAAAVGQPRWSATTRNKGRSAPSRSMVFTKLVPKAP